MREDTIKSYAKINLSLGILGKIKKNFHRIESLVSNISHIELETTPDFFDIFVEGCMFQQMSSEIT